MRKARVAAIVAPRWPTLALGFAGLMLINATFFHVAPFLWTRGRFSPGLITAVVLFLPLGIATMRAGHLDAIGLAEAFGIGARRMATPSSFSSSKTGPTSTRTAKGAPSEMTTELKEAWEEGLKDVSYPYAQTLGEQD